MKKALLALILVVILTPVFSQEIESQNVDYNMFECKNYNNKYFIATNAGIKNTPLGLRLGMFCKTGAYIANRIGKGEIYHSDSDNDTVKTNLVSITAGLIKPIFIKNKFSIYGFIGAGYGQWWKFRWERWTKDGYEIEGGLMTSYKKIMLSLSANMLNGYKTYAAWDCTIGLGYRF